MLLGPLVLFLPTHLNLFGFPIFRSLANMMKGIREIFVRTKFGLIYLIFDILTPLSAMVQLYHGDQF